MRPSRPISKTATGCCPGIARPAHRSVILACTVLTYHAKGKSETLSVIAPAPCREPSRCPMGGGWIAGRPGAGTGGGAFARAGPRSGRIRIVAAAMLTSALADGLGHHAEALDAGAPDHVHRLDHRAVGKARVGLEVERLVLAVAEGVAEHALEAAGRNALVVEIERAVLCHREDHALLDRGRPGGRARQIHVDAAVHHRRREHEG